MGLTELLTAFDRNRAIIAGRPIVERTLGQLHDVFADASAYGRALDELGHCAVYGVSAVEPAGGMGDLHYGVGIIYPGRVGDEYFMTRGHLHRWREAAEFYIGLNGSGLMLLEDERTGVAQSVALSPDSVVYVPGHTAHRTVNIGDVPLTYLGVYPAQAGHDYDAIVKNNFRQVVVARDGAPVVIERDAYLATLVR